MRNQQQALHDYYAAMSDQDLLSTAANKTSFIQVAQKLLTAELERRHLAPAPAVETQGNAPSRPARGVGKLVGTLRHALHH